MNSKITYSDSLQIVEGWMRPFISWGGFSIDPRILAEAITRPYWSSENECDISVDGETPINACTIATYIYASSAANFTEDSEERTVIALGLGYLLTNIDANPDLHMNQTLFPSNDADQSILAIAKERYSSLVELIRRRAPELLERIQPLKGSINLYLKDDTGHYKKVGGTDGWHDG